MSFCTHFGQGSGVWLPSLYHILCQGTVKGIVESDPPDGIVAKSALDSTVMSAQAVSPDLIDARMDIKRAIIEMTTRSSINVNPYNFFILLNPNPKITFLNQNRSKNTSLKSDKGSRYCLERHFTVFPGLGQADIRHRFLISNLYLCHYNTLLHRYQA